MAKQVSCTQVLIPPDRAPDVWINFLPLFWSLGGLCLCIFVYDPFSSFFMMLILFTCDLIHFSSGVSRIQLHAAQPRLSPASTQHWTRVASGEG